MTSPARLDSAVPGPTRTGTLGVPLAQPGSLKRARSELDGQSEARRPAGSQKGGSQVHRARVARGELGKTGRPAGRSLPPSVPSASQVRGDEGGGRPPCASLSPSLQPRARPQLGSAWEPLPPGGHTCGRALGPERQGPRPGDASEARRGAKHGAIGREPGAATAAGRFGRGAGRAWRTPTYRAPTCPIPSPAGAKRLGLDRRLQARTPWPGWRRRDLPASWLCLGAALLPGADRAGTAHLSRPRGFLFCCCWAAPSRAHWEVGGSASPQFPQVGKVSRPSRESR